MNTQIVGQGPRITGSFSAELNLRLSFWAIGTTIDLVVPASFLVLLGNLRCLSRRSLLARSR